MAEMKLESIKKTYDSGPTVVHDFNLEIHDGEFIVLVGPSGCGKSTTLRMIAGLEDITGGDFYIDDKRMNEVEPKNRDIAMVFQNYALYPHMSVYDNMAFGLKLRKTPKPEIKGRVEKAAEILGLTDYLDRKPKALSGGQRQRVALGRAIVREANVFLMDEPLSNLDAKLRVQMRAEITKLHKRLKTPKPEIKERVAKAAEILGLTDYLDRKPKALSGGQRQRVALGRAIVREANVFLMDEPLSNLDAKLRVQMRAEITKLHKRLKT